MFITLGAPHTYGNVLVMLKWLTDLIKINKKKD